MRLPISSLHDQESIQVVRYGSTSDRFPPVRSTVQYEQDDLQLRRRQIRLPAMSTGSSSSEGTDGVYEKGVEAELAVILVPRKLSRRSKARGWKRLNVEVSGKSNDRSFAAWLVQTRGDLADNPPCILVYYRPDMANFMASLPDYMSWQDLALLGTHDSAAFFGYPYAQCQQPATSVTQQLKDGVRCLDLRMRVIDGELIMYHGIRSQRAHFTYILSEIHAFLSFHPSESILVSLKEEVPPLDPSFASLVWAALGPHVDQFWFLETRLPTLGEVRGMAMIMPRFPIPDPQPGTWDKGVGLKLDSWPDDNPDGFELDCGPDRVRVQDWYGVPSFLRIPEKLKVVQDHLDPTISALSLHPSSVGPTQPLTISYLSAATIPLAPPCVLAKGFGWPSIGLGVEGLNSRFMLWLLELMCDGKRISGIVPVDFYREVGDIAELLVAMNQMGLLDTAGEVGETARGRASNETGVDSGS